MAERLAVRVPRLRLEGRPDAQARELSTEAEALGGELGEEMKTARQFVRGVARLPGAQGDKEPGVRALRRGYRPQDSDSTPGASHQGEAPPGFL